MKLEFSRQFSETYSNMNFQENPPIGTPVVSFVQTDRRTNMMKPIVAFHNFANAPKNVSNVAPASKL